MAFPRGAAAGSGACVTRQSSSIARAVARQASGACARGHGLAGEHEMPRQACRGSESGPGGSPHPPQVPAVDPRDAAAPPRGTTAPPFGGRGAGWVLNGGHPEWVGGGSPARGGSRIMHSSTIDALVPSRAVLRVPYMRSTARPRRIGSDCRAMHARRRATRPRDDQHPPSGARRYPPGAAAPPRETDHTHLRRPPLSARSPLAAGPGGSRPPRRARTPGGTALRRRPARHPCLACRACRNSIRRTPRSGPNQPSTDEYTSSSSPRRSVSLKFWAR